MAIDRDGFTILETLIALMILSLCMMTGIEMIAISSKSLSSAREYQAASRIAEMVFLNISSGGNTDRSKKEGAVNSMHWEYEDTEIDQREKKSSYFKIVTVTAGNQRKFKFIRFHQSRIDD